MSVNQEKLLDAVCGNAKEFDAVVSSVEVGGDMECEVMAIFVQWAHASVLSYRCNASRH